MGSAEARYERFHHNDRRPDQRHAAQRDRDRVLYSTALRRLGHVTQVVSPTEGIVFHNRLTHSFEVAQIGRRVAERLTDSEKGRSRAQWLGGLDPDVVETAALVHDLGHPPHGHAVEKELDRIVHREHGLLDGYEGNAQSFRIVTKLAMRSRRVPGLNLTRACLNACLKYPWFRSDDEGEREHGKWGAYRSEEEEFEWATQGRPARPSLEAEIMDWADDVAYAVHDVDDFYRAGLIPLDRLRNLEDHEVGRFCRGASQRLDVAPDDVRQVLEQVVESGPIIESYSGTDEKRQQLRTFTAGLIGKYVNAVTLADGPGDEPLLRVPEELRVQVDVLKELTWFYIIDNRAIKTQQYGQRRVVAELFEIYLSAGSSQDDDYLGVLPAGYREQLEHTEEEKGRVRLVADLLASMTERQLAVAHRKLTGVDPGSITDLI